MAQNNGEHPFGSHKENSDNTVGGIRSCMLGMQHNTRHKASGLEYLSMIASQISEPVLLVDNDMNISFCNSAAEKFFGPDKTFGASENLMARDAISARRAVSRAISKCTSQRVQLGHGRQPEFLLDILVTPLKDNDGKVNGCLVVGRELTALNSYDHQRRDMVAMLSHDIRLPMSMINLYIDDLLGSPDAGYDDYTSVLRNIKDAAAKTSLLLDDFIMFSKFDAGSISINPYPESIKTVVSVSLSSLKRMLDGSSASIHVSIPDDLPLVMVDLNRFGRIISNLITNSLKHGHKGINIRIRSFQDEQNGMVLIEVSDDGPGIAEKDLPYVFDRYYSASKESGGKGHGLGLAIVQQITEMHGGSVRIDSQEGKGTTVALSLPVAPPSA